MKQFLTLGLAAVLVLGIAACGEKKTDDGGAPAGTTTGVDTATPAAGAATGAPADAGTVREYTFHATVKKIDTERQMITIDHEKIGDYMDAMTMPFKVADPAILTQVKVGDETHVTLRVAGDQALITKVNAKEEEGAEH